MRHELKTDPKVFDAVVNGLKTFEIRKNDRNFQVGDELTLRKTRYTNEEMKSGMPLEFTGDFWTVKAVYILFGPIYGLQDGWCIMSIKPLSTANDRTQSSAERREGEQANDRKQPHRLDEIVNPAVLSEVLNGMVSAFNAEREKTEPFKELFKAGSSFTGLLRKTENEGTRIVLDACLVLEQKGIKITTEIYDFLLALPFISHKLEKQIAATDGHCCCVDKTFLLLAEKLKEMTNEG